MDGSLDGNANNCVNVVSLNIAREMINDKLNMDITEDLSKMTVTCEEEKTSTNQNNSKQTAELTDEQYLDENAHPNRNRSDTSCADSESGAGSFTEQTENSLQFVEYQQGVPGYSPMMYQQTLPYYLYNGHTVAPFPFGHATAPCQLYNGQNIGYYQMQHSFPVPYSYPPQSIPQEQYNGLPFSNENGSDEDRNENTDNQTSVTSDQTLNTLNEATASPEVESSTPIDQDALQNDYAHTSPQEMNTYQNPEFYYNQHQQTPYNYECTSPSQLYHYPQRHMEMNTIPSGYPCPMFDIPQNMNAQGMEKQKFQYPAIYVSGTGLITVLMKNDVSVETTLDQTLRLVNHQQKLVASINSRGNASYLFHPAAHILQDLTTTEAEIFLGRKVKMTTDNITFANNFNCYKFDYNNFESATPNFADLSKDKSVSFLFSENTQSNSDILQKCSDVVSKAECERSQKGGLCIRINGYKIIQTVKGDVIVTGRGKYLRMSPTTSVLRLDTNFVKMDIEMNWNIRITRGTHTVNASHLGFVVSNGKIEAAFDDKNKVHACKLPHRRPLITDDGNGNDGNNSDNQTDSSFQERY